MFMQDIARLAPVAIAVPGFPLASGLVAATLVETRAGWRAAGTLAVGDAVHTLDGGLRRIVALDRAWLMPDTGAGVIDLPGGAFGNDDDIALLPGQHLLTDLFPTDAGVGGIPDALAVLLPAAALDGYHGARRRPARQPVEVVTPMFEDEEYVWAASGLLLYCPAALAGAHAAPSANGMFPRIGEPTARRLLAARAAEDWALPGWAA
jgi:hypothetical protein